MMIKSPQFHPQCDIDKFNAPITNTIMKVNLLGRDITISTQKRPTPTPRPILFVYAHEEDTWAAEFMSRFQIALEPFYEEGSAPEFDYLTINDEEGEELYERIREHHFFYNKPKADFPSHIITIGDRCSQEIVRFREAYNMWNVTQMFYAHHNPFDTDLIRVEGDFVVNTHGTFMFNDNNYLRQIRTLKSLRPDIKNLAVVFDPESGYDFLQARLRHSAHMIAYECTRNNIACETHALSLQKNPTESLQHLIGKADAIITLRDTTASIQMDDIITFGNTHGITIMTSELVSVLRGAALGFGNLPCAYIAKMIRIMMQEAHEKKYHVADGLCSIPNVRSIMEPTRVVHCKAAFKSQGIHLSRQQEDLVDLISSYYAEGEYLLS